MQRGTAAVAEFTVLIVQGMSSTRQLSLSLVMQCRGLAFQGSTLEQGTALSSKKMQSPCPAESMVCNEEPPGGGFSTVGRLEDAVTEGRTDGTAKKKMQKFALQIAYNGGGYYGMQRNSGVPDRPTIEDVLLSALLKAQCVPESSAVNPRELHFQRCARTDKGVSAVGQMVSTKLIAPNHDVVEKINSHLPAQIRVLGITRATQRFNSKTFCDARTYSYTLPTFALCRNGQALPDPSFRLPREDFHSINQLLAFYRGTHNFHNFTQRRTALDPGAIRHIIHTICLEPFIHSDHEFISVEITGQSFMLHQIRKMLGLAIGMARGLVLESALPELMQADQRSRIAPAPGLGLVLEKTHYLYYNRRFGGDGIHRPLSWEDLEPAMSSFRQRHILPAIIQGELEELSMALWLQHITQYQLIEML